MRILYLTSKPAYPIIDGGCRAMAEMLECFALNGWKVTQLTISTEKHPFRKDAFPEPFSDVEHVYTSTKVRPWPALKALISGNNYNVSRFDTEGFRHALSEKLASREFDIIFMEGLFITPYLEMCRKLTRATLVVRTHNVEFHIWKRIADNTSGKLKKWYLNRLVGSLKEFELETLNRADLLLTITNEDRQALHDEGVRTPMVNIPFSLPEQRVKQDYENNDFFFLGSMNWEPNRETVKALTARIFPAIRKRLPEAKLYMAGSFMKEGIQQEQEGIVLSGFVDDPMDFFREKGIFLCPIFSGSGVRIKIMEAMSAGSTVITSSLGASGIPESTENLIIADSDKELIEQAILVYRDPQLRKVLGMKAAACIQANFSRAVVSSKLKNVLESQQA